MKVHVITTWLEHHLGTGSFAAATVGKATTGFISAVLVSGAHSRIGWPQIFSPQTWVTLTLCLVGCLMIACGQDKVGRALHQRALEKEVETRLYAKLPEPTDLILGVRGTVPVNSLPETTALRLQVATKGGQLFSSELKHSQLTELPPAPTYLLGKYLIPWRSVVEGATSEESRVEARQIESLDAWRGVESLEVRLAAQDAEPVPLPDSLDIYLCGSGWAPGSLFVKVFEGQRTAGESGQPPPLSAATYEDRPPESVGDKVSRWLSGNVEDRLWLLLAGYRASGALLLAAGACFLLSKRMRPISQTSTKSETVTGAPKGGRAPLVPPWLVLLVQAALLFGALGHLSHFRLHPPGVAEGERAFLIDEDAYLSHPLASEVSWDSFCKGLAHKRTFLFPLVLNGVRSLTPSFAAWPFCEMAVRALAAIVFFLGLRSGGVGGWLATLAASCLLYSGLRWAEFLHQTIHIDTMAECLAVLCIGTLLLVVGRPRNLLTWSALALSLFLTYQGRPAYLFLVALIPVLGLLLTGLFWDRTEWLRRRLAVGLALVGLSFIPYLGWCTLRWLTVGHFGLVSFGGVSIVSITGLFLTDDVLPDLPPEMRAFAEAVLQESAAKPEWKSPVDTNGRFDPEIVGDEVLFGEAIVARLGIFESKGQELYGENAVLLNQKLAETGKALIRARPRHYVNWLLTAARIGVKRMIALDRLSRRLAPVLAVLLVAWHLVWVWKRLRGSPRLLRGGAGHSGVSLLELNVIILIAVSFALSSLLLVILVAPPEMRYMTPAGVFFAPVTVTLAVVVGQRIRALWWT